MTTSPLRALFSTKLDFAQKGILIGLLSDHYDYEIKKQSLLEDARLQILQYFYELEHDIKKYIDFSKGRIKITYPSIEIVRFTIDDKSIFFTRSDDSIDVCKSWPEEDAFYVIQVKKVGYSIQCVCHPYPYNNETPKFNIDQFSINDLLDPLIREITDNFPST